jgi:hypothetical protein
MRVTKYGKKLYRVTRRCGQKSFIGFRITLGDLGRIQGSEALFNELNAIRKHSNIWVS